MVRIYIYSRDLIKKNKTTPRKLCETDLLIDNNLELTINDDRKLIEAAIRLYIDLQSSFTDLRSMFPDLLA